MEAWRRRNTTSITLSKTLAVIKVTSSPVISGFMVSDVFVLFCVLLGLFGLSGLSYFFKIQINRYS